ncbi:WD40 repeat domain-containing protein [Aspergillus stella-maris]|uniref:WD40 repeat domain-containing protein n=1 Tax=Aspergillus stella-maris TaxID=1810926 RepID=UPI003CCDA3AA
MRRLLIVARDTRLTWDEAERHDNTGAVLYTLQHAQRVIAVVFSPDGNRVATASKDRVIRVWSIETGNLIGQSGQFSHFVSAVEFFPNRQSLVSASSGTISIWNIDTPEWTLQTKLGISGNTRPWSNRTITKLAISPDDKLIVTAAETMVSTRFLKVWGIETGSLKVKIHGPTGPNSSLVFSPDSQRLAAICKEEKDLYIWDLDTGKLTVKVDNGSFWAGAPVFLLLVTWLLLLRIMDVLIFGGLRCNKDTYYSVFNGYYSICSF